MHLILSNSPDPRPCIFQLVLLLCYTMADNFNGKFPKKCKQTILFTIPVTSCESEISVSALCKLKAFYNLATIIEVDLDDVYSREICSFAPKKTTSL